MAAKLPPLEAPIVARKGAAARPEPRRAEPEPRTTPHGTRRLEVPKKGGEPLVHITTRLPEPLIQRLDEAVYRRKVPVQEIVREALDRYLAEEGFI